MLNIPHPAAFLRELRGSFSQKLRMAYQLFFQPPLLPELLMRSEVLGHRLMPLPAIDADGVAQLKDLARAHGWL